jgi:hypothetical protein
MGPPEVGLEEGAVEKGLLRKGEVGEKVWVDDGGSISQDKVRRQDWRIMEKEAGESGSWVEV